MANALKQSISVVSGKGGVGKSLITINLAEALADRGLRVAIFDVDIGQSDAAVLLNEAPRYTLADYLTTSCGLAGLTHTTETGITLVSGGGNLPEHLASKEDLYDVIDLVQRHLEREHDIVLIDAPAGRGALVQWALDRTHRGLLVLVDEPTAINDAYCLTKLVWMRAPDYPLNLVVNLSEEADVAKDVARRFGKVTEQFLGQKPTFLGWVPFARSVWASVKKQEPIYRSTEPPAYAFEAMSEILASGKQEALETT